MYTQTCTHARYGHPNPRMWQTESTFSALGRKSGIIAKHARSASSKGGEHSASMRGSYGVCCYRSPYHVTLWSVASHVVRPRVELRSHPELEDIIYISAQARRIENMFTLHRNVCRDSPTLVARSDPPKRRWQPRQEHDRMAHTPPNHHCHTTVCPNEPHRG